MTPVGKCPIMRGMALDGPIRLASPADAVAIARIYNEGIDDRIATFETDHRSPEQIVATLQAKGDRYPTVVLEDHGDVIAWAGAGAYRERLAYAGWPSTPCMWRGGPRARRRTRHLEGLCRAYAERGFWKLVSRILSENAASIALHERCGFRVVGVYQRTRASTACGATA